MLRHRRSPRALNRYLKDLVDRLLAKGPDDLNRREQMALLLNAQAVAELHDRIWSVPENQLSSWWKLAMRHYNTLTDRPQTALYR
jgi:membrane glycosyltransferase